MIHEGKARMTEKESAPAELIVPRRTVLIGLAAVAAEVLMVGCRRERAYEKYPVHDDITASVFWVGEDSKESIIPNRGSAWVENWVEHYGGIDSPEASARHDFTPKENPYYAALPFSDYTDNGPKSPSELAMVPGYDGTPLQDGESILKNRWIKVTHANERGETRTVYVQWEDVGPTETNDADYVWGNKRPKFKHAGIDLSPTAARHLGLDGMGEVSWQFVDDADVPDGPWKEIVTTSPPSF